MAVIFISLQQIPFMLFKYYSADFQIMSYHDVISWVSLNELFVSK